MTVVGVVHPGAMGSAVGARLRDAGHEVRWASAGRGASTARRAGRSGLDDIGTVAALAAGCEVVVSLCPPHAARDVAVEVADAGFSGVYLDANAVAPVTALAMKAALATAQVVDGGIIGPPPAAAGTTRLYLSGPPVARHAVGALFDGTVVQVLPCGEEIGRASAIKLAFAAWTKGSAALRLAVADLAAAAGVDGEWNEATGWADPSSAEDLRRARERAAERGWRWAGEMEEITAMAKSLAVPSGFWSAAAARFYAEPRPTDD